MNPIPVDKYGPEQQQLTNAGWQCRELLGFMGAAGPLWTRKSADSWSYGLLAQDRHLNPAGVVHGGALVTLMDHAISTIAWEACGRQPCLTLQLDTHFLAAVRERNFVESRVHIEKKTSSLFFMRGSLCTDDGQTVVLTAQALMKIVARD